MTLLVWAALTLPSLTVVAKYSGLVGVGAYGALVAFAIRLAPGVCARLAARHVAMLAVTTWLVMALAFATVYPRVNTRIAGAGSDDDDSHDAGVAALLSATSPYDRRTYLGGGLNQLPGSFILAAPFAIIGGSALQNLFWIPLFFIAMRSRAADARTLLVMAWLTATSAAAAHGIVTGSSYASNTISVLLGMLAVARYPHRWAAAVFCGVAMCSRANFLLLLAPLCVLLWRVHGPRRAVGVALIVTATVSALTLPFDPLRPGFPPVTGGFGRLEALDDLAPGAGLVALALTLVATLVLSWRVVDEHTLFLFSGAIQAVPIALGVAIGAFIDRNAAMAFLPYGTFATWFVLAGVTPRLEAWLSSHAWLRYSGFPSTAG